VPDDIDHACRHRAPPALTPPPGSYSGVQYVSLASSTPGTSIRYTLDGSEPTPKSPEVRGPLPARGQVWVAAFDAAGRKGHTAKLAVP
jgi:hypothetical protein